MLNRLSLRIEYRALRHHPNVCFHADSITSREMRMDVQGGGNGSSSFSDSNMMNCSECELFVFRKKRVFKAHLHKLAEFAFVQPHFRGIFIFSQKSRMEHRGIIGGEDHRNSVAP